jgi:outer membrane protein TolC
MVRKILIIALTLFSIWYPSIGNQQDTLDLQYCYSKARELSPLKKQELLNKSIHELNYQNSGSSYLPKLYINGKASYQSEVITIPGLSMVPEFPIIPKEQFNVSINLQQNLYDGGLSKHSRHIDESQLVIAEMDLETQLYRLNETINSIYFAILNLQEGLKILDKSLENLISQRKLIESRVKNGVILESNLFNIEKQILTIEQDIISVESDRNVMCTMLSEWIGQDVTDNTILLIPDSPGLDQPLGINRPEMGLFESQRNLLDAQYGISNINRTPKIWAFAQGGIGQPNPMNFFEVTPETYYIFGIQLNWDIYDWGQTSRKKQVFEMQKAIVDTRQQDFERNLNIGMIKEYKEIEKLKEILYKDTQIIELQEMIVKSSFSELENGVITSTEYLIELNTLIQAQIKRAQHELGLSHTYVNIYTSTGNNLNSNNIENE